MYIWITPSEYKSIENSYFSFTFKLHDKKK